MEREALLKLLKDREVVLAIAEALASVPEAASALFKAAAASPEAVAALLRATGPEAAAELLRRAAESPEAVRAAVQLLSRPEVAAVVFRAAGPEALRAIAEAAAASPEAAMRLAAAVAPHLAVPLNVTTREDVKALADSMAAVEGAVRALEGRVAAVEAAVADIKASMVTREGLQRALENLVTKEDAAKFATKEDLQNLVTKEDAQRFATKEDLRRLEERMVTKEDAKQFATKDDIRRIENRMVTREMFERITTSPEEEAREVVGLALERRGLKAECGEFAVEGMEWDGLCLAGGLAVLIEAKVRSGSAKVEETAERLRRLAASPPPQLAGRRPVAAHYAMKLHDEPAAVEAARRHRVWLFKDRKELTRLEEALSG